MANLFVGLYRAWNEELNEAKKCHVRVDRVNSGPQSIPTRSLTGSGSRVHTPKRSDTAVEGTYRPSILGEIDLNATHGKPNHSKKQVKSKVVVNIRTVSKTFGSSIDRAFRASKLLFFGGFLREKNTFWLSQSRMTAESHDFFLLLVLGSLYSILDGVHVKTFASNGIGHEIEGTLLRQQLLTPPSFKIPCKGHGNSHHEPGSKDESHQRFQFLGNKGSHKDAFNHAFG
mmetsp:Transcript_20046/g.41938  ORF Transcript_20046/g.41938 Transcript_20046/m.41938 type:complete len:229 (-) Transcript_20046:390-1076(-)